MAAAAAKEAFAPAARIPLSSGHTIPRIHLGVYMTSGRECENAVIEALTAGYRAIDSAAWYYNEGDVGRGIQRFLSSNPSISREDIFFTTKLQNNESYDATRKAIRTSLKKSGLEYIDLYLLHSPYGGPKKRYECWRAVEDAIEEGVIKTGGVSNFGVRHLEQLLAENLKIKPAVNQIEVHPFNTQTAITEFCAKHNILIEAYAPLARALRMKHPTITTLSKKYSCTPAQLLVRWSLQKGFVPLPKSIKKERIVANADVQGFEIEDIDVQEMDSLDEHLVTDWDPTDAP